MQNQPEQVSPTSKAQDPPSTNPQIPQRRVLSNEKPTDSPFARNSSLPYKSTIFKAQEAFGKLGLPEEQKPTASQLAAKRFTDLRQGLLNRSKVDRSRVQTSPEAFGTGFSRRFVEEAGGRSNLPDRLKKSIVDLQKSIFDPAFRRMTANPVPSQKQIQAFRRVKNEPFFPESLVYKVKKVSMAKKLDPEIGKIRLRMDKFGSQDLNKFPAKLARPSLERPFLDDPSSVSSKKTLSKNLPLDDAGSLTEKTSRPDKSPLPFPQQRFEVHKSPLFLPQKNAEANPARPNLQDPSDQRTNLKPPMLNETADLLLSSRKRSELRPVPAVQVKPLVAFPRGPVSDRRTNFSQERPVHKRMSAMSVGREETINLKKPERNSSAEDTLAQFRAQFLKKDPLIQGAFKLGKEKETSVIEEEEQRTSTDPIKYGKKYGGSYKVDKSSVVLTEEEDTPGNSKIDKSKVAFPKAGEKVQMADKKTDFGKKSQLKDSQPKIEAKDKITPNKPENTLSQNKDLANPLEQTPGPTSNILSESKSSDDSELKEEEKDVVPRIEALYQAQSSQNKELGVIPEAEDEGRSISSKFPTDLHFMAKQNTEKISSEESKNRPSLDSKESGPSSQARLSEPENYPGSGKEEQTRAPSQSLKAVAQDERAEPLVRRNTLTELPVKKKSPSPAKRSDFKGDDKGINWAKKEKRNEPIDTEVIAESEKSQGDQSYLKAEESKAKIEEEREGVLKAKLPKEQSKFTELGKSVKKQEIQGQGQKSQVADLKLAQNQNLIDENLPSKTINNPTDEPETPKIGPETKADLEKSSNISWNFSKNENPASSKKPTDLPAKNEPTDIEKSIQPAEMPRNFTFAKPALKKQKIDQSEEFTEPQFVPDELLESSRHLSQLLKSKEENIEGQVKSQEKNPFENSKADFDLKETKQEEKPLVKIPAIEPISIEILSLQDKNFKDKAKIETIEPSFFAIEKHFEQNLRSAIKNKPIEVSFWEKNMREEKIDFNKNEIKGIEISQAILISLPEEKIKEIHQLPLIEPFYFENFAIFEDDLLKSDKLKTIEPINISFTNLKEENLRGISKPAKILPEIFLKYSEPENKIMKVLRISNLEPVSINLVHKKHEPIRKAIKPRAIEPKAKKFTSLPAESLQSKISPFPEKPSQASNEKPALQNLTSSPSKKVLSNRFAQNTGKSGEKSSKELEDSPKSKSSLKSSNSKANSSKENFGQPAKTSSKNPSNKSENEEAQQIQRPVQNRGKELTAPARIKGERVRIDIPEPEQTKAENTRRFVSEPEDNRAGQKDALNPRERDSDDSGKKAANFDQKPEGGLLQSSSKSALSSYLLENQSESSQLSKQDDVEKLLDSLKSSTKLQRTKYFGAFCCLFLFASSFLWIILLKILNDKNAFLADIILNGPTLGKFHTTYTEFFLNYDHNRDAFLKSKSELTDKNAKDYIKQAKGLAAVSAMKTDNSVSMLTIKMKLAERVGRIPSQSNQPSDRFLADGKTSGHFDPHKKVSDQVEKIKMRLKEMKIELGRFKEKRDSIAAYLQEVQQRVQEMYHRAFALIDNYGAFYVMTKRIWAATESIYQTNKKQAEEVISEMKTPHSSMIYEKHKNVKLFVLNYKQWAKVAVFPNLQLNNERRTILTCTIKAEVLDPGFFYLGGRFDFFLALNGEKKITREAFDNEVRSEKTSVLIPQLLEVPPGRNRIELFAEVPEKDLLFSKLYVNCVSLLEFKQISEFPKIGDK